MTAFFNTGLTQQQFLDQYWQKKPLLIRQAFAEFTTPISPDELAGLACEPDIESRIIQEHSDEGHWKVQTGPFDEQTFAELPETHWTMLVQDVDKHFPETQTILDPFRFIPDWRRDDLMVSYAPEFGSVGAHTDGYDVFLIQAMGSRRWQISDHPVLDPDLIENIDIKVLKRFDADQSWDLQPGDILYLPPHFAHHGIALNECMTFSVGFRAPTKQELFENVVDTLMEQSLATERYSDPDLDINLHQTEIDSATMERVKQQLKQIIDNGDDAISLALGRLVTETKPSLDEFVAKQMVDEVDEHQLDELFANNGCLHRNYFGRFAWTQQGAVFFSGQEYCLNEVNQELMTLLTENTHLTQRDWQTIKQSPEYVQLLCRLVESGAWYQD